jgi:hypothetical protein
MALGAAVVGREYKSSVDLLPAPASWRGFARVLLLHKRGRTPVTRSCGESARIRQLALLSSSETIRSGYSPIRVRQGSSSGFKTVIQCAWRLCTTHGLRGESSQLQSQMCLSLLCLLAWNYSELLQARGLGAASCQHRRNTLVWYVAR